MESSCYFRWPPLLVTGHSPCSLSCLQEGTSISVAKGFVESQSGEGGSDSTGRFTVCAFVVYRKREEHQILRNKHSQQRCSMSSPIKIKQKPKRCSRNTAGGWAFNLNIFFYVFVLRQCVLCVVGCVLYPVRLTECLNDDGLMDGLIDRLIIILWHLLLLLCIVCMCVAWCDQMFFIVNRRPSESPRQISLQGQSIWNMKLNWWKSLNYKLNGKHLLIIM